MELIFRTNLSSYFLHKRTHVLPQNESSILKEFRSWAVVVAQSVEQSLPTPEVCGSNPVIGKFYI